MMTGSSACVFLTGVLVLNTGAPSQETALLTERISAARNLCERYVRSFGSDETDLVYTSRLDTAKGQASFESAEAVAREFVRGIHKPWGYGAGFEDVAYHNGTLLFALCEAYDATGEPYFASLARRIFAGMKRIGTLSPVAGFVPRGPHPNGKSYYRDSSLDQHTLYVCGLWRYYHSKIADAEQKAFIRKTTDAIASRMERNKWFVLVEDDSRQAHAGGGDWHRSDHLLLFMLAAARDVTGSEHWQAEYDRYSNERNGSRWERLAQPLTKTLPRYTFFNNQKAFRLNVLARVEKEPTRQRIALDHLRRTAADMFEGNFFTHWRRLDWIGDGKNDEYVNLYLKPLGYTTTSVASIFDLWSKYDASRHGIKLPDGVYRSYIGPTMTVPLMSWQIAVLSGDIELCRRVSDRIPALQKRMDPDRLPSGWSWNYATVLTLLDVAHRATCSDARDGGSP